MNSQSIFPPYRAKQVQRRNHRGFFTAVLFTPESDQLLEQSKFNSPCQWYSNDSFKLGDFYNLIRRYHSDRERYNVNILTIYLSWLISILRDAGDLVPAKIISPSLGYLKPSMISVLQSIVHRGRSLVVTAAFAAISFPINMTPKVF